VGLVAVVGQKIKNGYEEKDKSQPK